MLGEFYDLPSSAPADPEHRDVSDNPSTIEKHFDWPNDLIDRIKRVLGTPCSTPSPPEFRFELTEDAMQHNLAVLEKYEYDLGQALEAQNDSPLGPGKEFRPANVLNAIFSHHPLWN